MIIYLSSPRHREKPTRQSLGKAQHQRTHGETQTIILDFLQRSKYILHSTPRNAVLRTSIIECLLSWQSADTEETLAKFAETACDYTETGYGHLSPVHQHFVALYTAIILYIDDIGEQHLDAIKQFASRLTCGEKQLCPALNALVQLLRQAHELWTDVGADAIIAGTLDSVTAMYIENTTRDMEIKPKATLYPYYLRTRSGICPPYIHFIFMKHWRPTTKSYLQMLP